MNKKLYFSPVVEMFQERLDACLCDGSLNGTLEGVESTDYQW